MLRTSVILVGTTEIPSYLAMGKPKSIFSSRKIFCHTIARNAAQLPKNVLRVFERVKAYSLQALTRTSSEKKK